jgi:hypothetical protein
MNKVIKRIIKNCWECPFVQMYRCSITKDIPVIMKYETTIPEWCPLEEAED